MKTFSKSALAINVAAIALAASSASFGAEINLTLAHALNETHSAHIAMKEMADLINKNSNGRIEVQIFPNGQMGTAAETLEMCMSGDISMVHVGAPQLGTYDDAYHVFGLPYLFKDKNEYYKVMQSDAMQNFFYSTADKGFVTLNFLSSGDRNFYTPKKAIKSPADLKGMKIRVQDMKTQIDMVKAMGGTPVAMGYGEVYTALQTGVIDGTENNVLSLTEANHGEICKVYSMDGHAMIPDAIVMNGDAWKELSADDQKIIRDAATEAMQHQLVAWDKATDAAIAKAKTMGVEFVTDIDKKPFIDATESVRAKYAKEYPGVKKMLELIESAK